MAKKYNPDQMPLIVPDSSWVRPSELPDIKPDDLGLDTENKDDGLASGRGPGWVYGAGRVLGVGASWREGKTLRKAYFPISHPDTENFDKAQVASWLKTITKRAKRIVFQNAPYDIGWLEADLGVPVSAYGNKIDDVGCMAVMIDESNRNGFDLDAIAKRCGVAGKDDTLLKEAAHAYGIRPVDSEIKGNLWRLPARYVGPYGEQDPASTIECAEVMRPELAQQGLLRAYQLEMDLIPMVHAMRKRGIRLDISHCEVSRDKLLEMRDATFAELGRRLGGRTPTIDDIRDTKWLWNTFHNEQVPYNESEGGKASFGREWMRQGYVGRYQEGKQGHWLPQLIARAKQCHEAADKFIQGYLLDFAHRGRIHASVNQFKSEDGGTKTHRFSYSDPPLQQMPSRPEIFLKEWTLTKDIAAMIRGAFLPESGEKWFSPDYSQQEYRLIVEYAVRLGCSKADEALEKYLRDPNTDFHNMVVDMTGLIRQRAKDCNFAKSYGAGKYKFALMTGMELEEAERVMGQYDEEMPFVKQLMSKCTKAADQRGYIVMLDGARMHFNFWEAAWLTKEERDRGWREHHPMGECELDEARRRTQQKDHPWYGARLKRAFTHKAGNGLIQGGAARMGKMAMREMWRAGYVPLLQIHDEFPCSVAREKDGKRIGEIMRGVGSEFKARVPFRVDEEYGHNWAAAKLPWREAKFAA